MIENIVYTRKQMRELGIFTAEYVFNYEEGSFSATLDLKAEGHNGLLRLFFTFDDGRKIIAPVYWWQRYLGFYEIPIGSRLNLIFTKETKGVFLTKAEAV